MYAIVSNLEQNRGAILGKYQTLEKALTEKTAMVLRDLAATEVENGGTLSSIENNYKIFYLGPLQSF